MSIEIPRLWTESEIRGICFKEMESVKIIPSVLDSTIDKPEPAEPLIVRSGKTVVAEDVDKINYICTDINHYKGVEAYINRWDFAKSDIWKSFTGENPDITELTDEIAKLRPMVRSAITTEPSKMFGVNKDHVILYNGMHFELSCCRLATASELKEPS